MPSSTGQRSHSKTNPEQGSGISFGLSGVMLIVVLILTRWWSHADYLLNADATHYARAIFVFDLASYSPHPPGYILYVFAARLVHLIVADPNLSYLIVGWCAQAMLSLLTLTFLRRLVDSWTALLLTLTVLLNPMFWFYGSVTAIYAADAMTFLLIAWAVERDTAQPSRRHAILVGFLWGLIGGARQFTAVLVTPLILWHLVRHNRRGDLVPILSAAVVGGLLWFVPLMVLVGGWTEYRLASRDVFAFYLNTRSPLFSTDFVGVFYNVMRWLSGLLQVVWPLLPLVAVGWYQWRRTPQSGGSTLHRSLRGILYTLTIPALLFFLLIHMGQPGYMLFLLAPLVVLIAIGARSYAASETRPTLIRYASAVTIVISVCWFTLAAPPDQQYDSYLSPREYAIPRNWPMIAEKVYKYQSDFTRPGILKWEAVLEGYLNAIQSCTPESTAILFLGERELTAAVFEHYTGEIPLVGRHAMTAEWCCQWGDCGPLELTASGNRTRLVLGEPLSTLFVVSLEDPPTGAIGMESPQLSRYGKSSFLLRRPIRSSVEDLEIEWGP